MSETAKKALLAVVCVAALAAAGFGAMRLFGSEQIEQGVNNSLPPGSKTGKQREMEDMQGGKSEERDLSGAGPSGG